MSIIEGGRFDFDDGGSYVGEWCDGRAHGLGVATGPENQGEYSGEWVMGFESRGVYIWPSGNIYCGGWMKGKRHGEGVQLKGKWTYRGDFSAGFCGRYGVKESHDSVAKYEGSWHLNLFDGFGIETSSDGSTYAGNWAKGLRHGLGVRKSAPFHIALSQKDPCSVRAATSQSSLLSANDSGNTDPAGRGGVSSPSGSSGLQPNNYDPTSTTERKMASDHHRSGFVLISASSSSGHDGTGNPGYNFGNGKEKKPSFRKTLFKKLRKQKSTGDLRSVRMGGSLRSTISTNSAVSNATNHSLPDTLQVQTREIIDPNTTEMYWGQWKEDKRSGYGIAERSDGLRYEGEWYNNKKDGYGATIFSNGAREEGRYKENVLVQALHKRSKLFALRHSRLRDSVEEAIKHAHDHAAEARDRVMEIAQQRAQTARNSAESAEMKAREAQMLSNHSREASRELAPDFVQLGVMWLKSRSKIGSQLGETLPPVLQKSTLVMDTARYCKGAGAPPGSISRTKHLPTQSQQGGMDQSNYLNPTDQECLEVSGGSRRGSFRSSFRRSGDKKSNFVKQIDSTGSPKTGDSGYCISIPTSNQSNKLSPTLPNHNQNYQQPIINEPIINAQHSMNNQQVPMNQHSVNIQPSMTTPLSMTQTNKLNLVSANIVERAAPIHFKAEIIDVGPANSSRSRPKFQTSNYHSSDGSPTNTNPDHYEHYGRGRNSATHSQNQYRTLDAHDYQSQQSPTSIQVPFSHRSPYKPGTARPPQCQEDEFSTTPRANKEQRRRSVPSIMTAKPQKLAASPANAATGSSGASNNNSSYSQRNGGHSAANDLLLEDATRSSEFLNSTTSVYIIENGIRKRVEAENSRPRQPPPLSPKSSRLAGRKRVIPLGMFEPQADELAELPRNYKIESSNFQTRHQMDGSLPDVTMCDEIKSRTGMLMSRQEASQLSQQRRQELLHEQERLKRGEIIIRMADLKDWLKQNIVLVLILLFNFMAAALFLHIMKK